MKWRSDKDGSVGGGGAIIKYFPHLSAFKDFWETVPAICAALNSPTRRMGRYLGFAQP